MLAQKTSYKTNFLPQDNVENYHPYYLQAFAYLKMKKYPEAIISMKIAANAGDIEASHRLGEIYFKGLFKTSINYKESIKYFQFAADKGDYDSILYLVEIYSNPKYEMINFQQLFKYAELGANLSDSNCICILAEMHFNGEYVERNLNTAKNLYNKAYKLGNSEGAAGLGTIYHKQQDYENAVKYYQLAAKAKNPNPVIFISLFHIYFYGNDVIKQNQKQGLEYLNKAVNFQYPLALCVLGALNYYGYGMKKNIAQAEKHLQQAANFNNAEALYLLAVIEYEKQKYDLNKIINYLEQASVSQHHSSICLLTIIRFYNSSSENFIKSAQLFFSHNEKNQPVFLEQKYYPQRINRMRQQQDIFICMQMLYIFKAYDEIINYCTDFKEELLSNPFDFDCSIIELIGDTHYAKKEYSEAIKYFKILQVCQEGKSADFEEYQFSYGNCLAQLKQLNDALECYLKILAYSDQDLNERHVSLLNNIAFIYYELKNYEQAIEFLSKAIICEQYNYKLHIHLGLCYQAQSSDKNDEDKYRLIEHANKSFQNADNIKPGCVEKHIYRLANKKTEDEKNATLDEEIIEYKVMHTDNKKLSFPSDRKKLSIPFQSALPTGEWGIKYPGVKDVGKGKLIFPVIWQNFTAQTTKIFVFIKATSKDIRNLQRRKPEVFERFLQGFQNHSCNKLVEHTRGQNGLKELHNKKAHHEKIYEYKNHADDRLFGPILTGKDGFQLIVLKQHGTHCK